MRLIDADIAKAKAECYNWDTIAIDNAPTIDAIPTEWIKEVICLAEKTGFTDYAYKLNVLLSDWAERKEE